MSEQDHYYVCQQQYNNNMARECHDVNQLKELDLPHGFDLERLQRHLTSLGELQINECKTATELASVLKEMSPLTRMLIAEVEKLLQLVLSLPVSVADAERSFSALRRLKTWLRCRMTQQRLTHVSLLHVHKDLLDELDVTSVMREFVSKTPERRSVFGTIEQLGK
jgi:hypothetical protein